jgi:branched-chain amino acid transport system ATP-binding protein
VRQTLAIADTAFVVENGRVTMSGRGSDLLNDDHVRQAYLGV